MPSSKGSSQPRDQTQVSLIAGGFFTVWATKKSKNTGVGGLSLPEGIFPTQESNRGLMHRRQILYQLSGIPGKPLWTLVDKKLVLRIVVLSRFSHVRLLVTPRTAGRYGQVPLSIEFPRQEYYSGLPFPAPGDVPDPGIEPASLMSPALAVRFFTTSATWEGQRQYSWPLSMREQSLGVPILKAVENSGIYCSWPSVSAVPNPRFPTKNHHSLFPVPVWSPSISFSVFILGC